MVNQKETDELNGTSYKGVVGSSKSINASGFGFTFLGISGMLVYNLYLLELGYFNSTLGSNFALWGTTIYGISNNIGQLISILIGRKFSFGGRLIWACSGLAVSLICIAIITLLRPPGGFVLALSMTLLLGVSGAIHQSASCGLAGAVSGTAMNYMSVGQALAGLFGWPLMFLIQWLFSYMGVSEEATFAGGPSPCESMTVLVAFVFGSIITICFIPYYIVEMSSDYQLLINESPNDPETDPKASKMHVFELVFGPSLIAWLILFITFLVFPGQVLRWKPSYSNYPGGPFFYSNMLIYVFQVFDVIGRYVAMIPISLSSKLVMNCTWPRVIIALAFYAATYSWWIFAGDAIRIFLVALFALSNGTLISWILRLGTERAAPIGAADVAGYIISFFLVNGIFCGSILALLIGGPSVGPAQLVAEPDWLEQFHTLIELSPESIQPA